MEFKQIKEQITRIFSNNGFYSIMFVLSIVYLLFPNNNHLVDSLSYGGSVKFGVDLFAAHHLLFSCFNRLIFIVIQFIYPTVDALKLIQFTNGIFALSSLLLLRKIIIKQTADVTKANAWILFVGCSFGVMRFAAEAETYILPIFFSLLSSYFYQNFLREKASKDIVLSGFFASVACLFHQIHLFWGIGLFLGLLFKKKLKPLFLFALTTPIVLVGYSLVLVYYNHIALSFNNLFHFLAEYYYSPNSDTLLGMKDLLITGITFFRTFFQVHGVILDVLRLAPVAYVLIPVVLVLLAIGVLKLFKTVKFKLLRSDISFERTHLLIFILQFGFAFYSHGNSEFMVMLPFTMAIFLSLFVEFDFLVLRNLSFAMLVWNLSFAILPYHFIDYQNDKELLRMIENNPDKIFILKERNTVVNEYFYAHGVQEYYRIIENGNKKVILKHKRNNEVFYTDVLTKKVPYNRVDFTTTNSSSNLLFVRHITRINSAMGGFYIDEVRSLD